MVQILKKSGLLVLLLMSLLLPISSRGQSKIDLSSNRIKGPLNLKGLGSPSVTFTQGGTPGSTNYQYAIVGTDAVGNTRSLYATDTTGNTTLNGTNFNIVTVAAWPTGGNFAPPTGACKVYRTTSAGTPSSTGFIGTISGCITGGSLNDTGLVGDSTNPPTDTSGVANVQFLSIVGGGSGFYSEAPLLGGAPAMAVIDCTECTATTDTIGLIMRDSAVASSTNPFIEQVMKSNGQVEFLIGNHLGFVNYQVGSAGTTEFTSYNTIQYDTINGGNINLSPGSGVGGTGGGDVVLKDALTGPIKGNGTGATLTGTGACSTQSGPFAFGPVGAVTCSAAPGGGTTTLVITPPSGIATPSITYICGGSDTGLLAGGGGPIVAGAQLGISTSKCTLQWTTATQNDIFTFWYYAL